MPKYSKAIGSGAAVQAEIFVPGMLGTHTSLDAPRRRHDNRMPGVSYRPGESYARWGRFSCEIPARSCDRTNSGEGVTSVARPSRASRPPSRTKTGAQSKQVEGDGNSHQLIDSGNCGSGERGDSAHSELETQGGKGVDVVSTPQRVSPGGTAPYLQVGVLEQQRIT